MSWFSVDKEGLRQINERLVERRGFGVIVAELYQNVMESMNEDLMGNLDAESTEYMPQEEVREVTEEIRVVLDKDFSKELLLATNYDCWMGHTNFDITPKIKDELKRFRKIRKVQSEQIFG